MIIVPIRQSDEDDKITCPKCGHTFKQEDEGPWPWCMVSFVFFAFIGIVLLLLAAALEALRVLNFTETDQFLGAYILVAIVVTIICGVIDFFTFGSRLKK